MEFGNDKEKENKFKQRLTEEFRRQCREMAAMAPKTHIEELEIDGKVYETELDGWSDEVLSYREIKPRKLKTVDTPAVSEVAKLKKDLNKAVQRIKALEGALKSTLKHSFGEAGAPGRIGGNNE